MFKSIRKVDGFTCYAQRSAYYLMENIFNFKKNNLNLKGEVWKDINFKALGLNAKAKLLLNPFDEGFSKEFYLYGFREPLNTFAIFKTIEKKKPFILDIGSNLGYFSLIEIQAGAKHVISVEPVPLTFSFLSRTLRDFKNVTLLNVAISDKQETLKLYLSNEYNVTSTSATLIRESKRKFLKEISVEAVPISTIVEQQQINAIRMDVEGYEYCILRDNVDDQIDTIFIELHVLPPYGKKQATKLLQRLNRQGFQANIVINEMGYGFYPLINYTGLKSTYKLIENLKERTLGGPRVQRDINLIKLSHEVQKGVLHLILER